ncbi:MAG TPA: cohesin domain-containing protein, partial [Bacteroidales bacterium]|nr:cohesin domain-containing protein [Bacteroidales bacterium]
MNRFISIISAVSLWVICYCVLAGGNASAQTTIGFSIANATITEKDTFSILFKADSSFTGKKVYAFRFGLSYNASYLECLGVSPAGTILSAWGAPTVNTQTAGKITVAGAGSSPLSGSGDMFRIKFRATRGGGTYVENIASISYLNEGSPSLSVKSSYILCNSRSYPDIYPDNYTLYVGDELQMNVSGGTAPYVYKVVDTAVALISAGSKVRAKGPGTTQVFVTDSKGEISYTTGVIDVRAIKLRVVHSAAWPGENFLVPVRIEIAPGTKVFAGSFELGFSGNIQGISSSAQQGDFQVSVQNKAYPNVMKVSFASSSGITASGILCYLGFKAVNSGMQYVNINSALFNESLLAITYNENAEIYSLPTLTITPNGANMMWGSTQKITVGNGTPPLTYQTSDTTIATIDALGNLYGKTGGKVKVKVTDSHGATQTSNDFLFYHNQFAVTNTDGVLDKDTRVPITTTLLPPGKAVFAFTGTITYNTTYLEFVRIDPVNAGMIVEGVNNNGSVNVVGASGSG